MKKSSLVPALGLTLFATLPAFAGEDPSTFCDSTRGCTPKMREVSAEFANGDDRFASESLIAFSGACYHLDPQYDPEKVQFGAFGFRREGTDLLAAGVLSYFYDKDPYEGMAPAEMLPKLEESGNGLSKVKFEGGQAILDFSVPETKLTYWFRETRNKSAMIVIGREAGADYLNLIFCELKRHS